MEKLVMRKIDIGTSNYTCVFSVPEDGNEKYGADHHYIVTDREHESSISSAKLYPVAEVQFQLGPIKENGVNGCHHEDLIAIVIDRLQQFQAGDYACRENALAITKLEEALHWLNHRTANRQRRGVEGTSHK